MNRSKEDNKPPKVIEPPNKGKEPSNKTRTPLKKLFTPWKYQESSLATNPSVKPPVSDGAGLSSNHGNRSCYFCSRAHDLDNCELFSKKTPELKREFLREKNICALPVTEQVTSQRTALTGRSANIAVGCIPPPSTLMDSSYHERKIAALLSRITTRR